MKYILFLIFAAITLVLSFIIMLPSLINWDWTTHFRAVIDGLHEMSDYIENY